MGPRAILDWFGKYRLHLGSISGPSVCEFACVFSRDVLFIETKNLLFAHIFERRCTTLRALILYVRLFKTIKHRCYISQT